MAAVQAAHYQPYRRPDESRWDPASRHVDHSATAPEASLHEAIANDQANGQANGHMNGRANGGIDDAALPRTSSTSASGFGAFSSSSSSSSSSSNANPTAASLLPGGRQSLSAISLRAHLLGVALGTCLCSTLGLLFCQSELWRLPFFVGILALFHFLEFYTTAACNTGAASVSAFLLTSNGSAYNVAHSLALLETLLAHTVLRYPAVVPQGLQGLRLALGLVLVVVGQGARSTAMARAGTNFNHTVQSYRKHGHELVTGGIYGLLRHPSYFGFFWWGLGSQIVLGNVVCLLGYALVLWRFFSTRIEKEEQLLVAFFGDDYVQYRKRTHVGIPFIP